MLRLYVFHHPGGELSHSRAVTVIFSPSRSTVNSSQPLVGLLISRSCSPLPPPIAQIETVSRVGTPLRWIPFDFTWLTKRNAPAGSSGWAAITKRLARSHMPPPWMICAASGVGTVAPSVAVGALAAVGFSLTFFQGIRCGRTPSVELNENTPPGARTTCV